MKRFRNDGCLCDATKADLFITSLGEVLRKNQLIPDLGSIDAKKLCEDNKLDWREVCLIQGKETSPLAKQWKKILDKEWRKRRSENLSKSENKFADHVDKLQAKYTEGRFRVYGQIYRHRQTIVLVTEFVELVSCDSLWEKILEVSRDTRANIWVMREDPRLDCVTHDKGTAQEKTIYGPGHGELERQVELSWRIESLANSQMESFFKTIKKKTNEIWKLSGVNVI